MEAGQEERNEEQRHFRRRIRASSAGVNRKEPLMDERPVNYELLCRYLYDYRLGTITFLELLERIENALNLRQPEKRDR